jgi:TPR repeat protein
MPATPAPTETANVPLGLATPAATPQAPEIDILMERGDALRVTGDFAAARLFYERAAEEGSAAAARAVGETYDPIVLDEAHARGVRGDARAAAGWYRKAIAGGDAQAQEMLRRLTAKYSG